MAVASVISVIVGDIVSAFAGLVAQLVLGTAAWYAVFYPTRRWLLELRNG
jgi:hypothetical protein